MSKFFVFLSMAIALAFASCAHNDAAQTESKASGDTLWLSRAMDAHVQLATVRDEPGQLEFSLSGRVEFDPTSVTHVYSLVNGVYRNIFVEQGARVTKGQVLAEVYSADVASAISDFQKASANLQQSKRLLERDRGLFAHDLEAKQDLEISENNVAQAQADYDRSLHTLKILGANERTTSPIFEITAPISGIVIENFAQPGAQVKSDGSSASFTVGSTNSLWITLDAYPDQVKALAVGDSVIVRAAGLDERPVATTIDYISPVVDPNTFATKLRCKLPNADGLLRPAMFVSASVMHRVGHGLYVPAQAVFLASDGKYYAFAKRADREYQKVELRPGTMQSSRVEVNGGLHEGDTVVADKALFLSDELASDQK